jgi:hypothetical protein
MLYELKAIFGFSERAQDECKPSLKVSIYHYLEIFIISCILGGVCIPFIYLLSLIPFGDASRGSKDYYNPWAITFSFILVSTCFGPIYFFFAAFASVGWKKATKRYLHLSVLFHVIVWPVLYCLLGIVFKIKFWYNYIEFTWFITCYSAGNFFIIIIYNFYTSRIPLWKMGVKSRQL